MSGRSSYASEGQLETERLRTQARVWEPEAETMFDQIGLRPGAHCVDLGSGAMGVLGPLSRRVGPEGRVVGVDMDGRLLEAAAEYVKEECQPNVELLEGDVFATGLPRQSFDLVHARFVLAPVGHGDDLLAEMLRLVKPGGVVAMQEPDTASWSVSPRCAAFEVLRDVLGEYLVMTGGDPNAGRKIFQMLRRARLKDVKARAAVKSLQDDHPYMRVVLLGISPNRAGVVENLLATERELDRAAEDLDERLKDPDTRMTTVTLIQAWGTR